MLGCGSEHEKALILLILEIGAGRTEGNCLLQCFPNFAAGWKHPASLKTMDAWFSYPDILIKLELDGLLNVERKKKFPR